MHSLCGYSKFIIVFKNGFWKDLIHFTAGKFLYIVKKYELMNRS